VAVSLSRGSGPLLVKFTWLRYLRAACGSDLRCLRLVGTCRGLVSHSAVGSRL
jgi:hypothetical protein